MRLSVILITVFSLLSCISDVNPTYEEDNFIISQEDIDQTELEMWICYNPDSELHGKICTEGCLVDGDYHTFCWHLDTNECENDFLTTVIEKACIEVGLL